MNYSLIRYWHLLKIYLKPQLGWVLLLAVLLFGDIGMQLVSPQVLRYFVDQAEAGATVEVLTRAAVIFLLVALGQQVMTVFATYVSERVGWAATNAMRADLALHCLQLDMAFHNEHTPGELIERIDGDVAKLSQFFSQFVIRILGSVVLLIGVLTVLYFEHVWAGLAMTIYAVVTLAGLLMFRNIAVPYWKEAREASADLFSFLEERLAGTVDIRANGAGAYVMRLLYHLTGNRLRKELKASVINIRLRYITTILHTVGVLMAVILGYYLYQDGAITIGTIILILYYTETLFRPLEMVTRQIEELQQATAAIERIDELYQAQRLIVDGPGTPVHTGALPVAFDDITFGYHAAEPVLKDISFRLEPGTVLGLLGRTGSGKTTITRLLFRLYDPDTGSVRLGEHDLRHMTLDHLRNRIGMVTQTVQLFQGTVRDNLTLFDRSIPDERILDILKDMGMWDWYQELPDGLDTMLQSDGEGLSAGEAQLLTFTRVFLRDPGLVVLDEASSLLDPATEAHIEQAVDRLMEHRTGIIIAHRLATVQRADKILILDDGRILEFGDREALASNPDSRFAQLLKTGLTEVLS